MRRSAIVSFGVLVVNVQNRRNNWIIGSQIFVSALGDSEVEHDIKVLYVVLHMSQTAITYYLNLQNCVAYRHPKYKKNKNAAYGTPQ